MALRLTRLAGPANVERPPAGRNPMTGRSIELATGRRLPQDRLQPLEAAQSKREGYIMRCTDSAVGRPPGLADRREVNGCPRLSCSLVGRAIGDDGRLSWCAAAAVTAHSTDSLHLSLICACIVWCCRTRTKATTRLCGASVPGAGVRAARFRWHCTLWRA